MTPADPTPPATERVLAGYCHDLNGQLANAAGFAYLMSAGADPEGPALHLREALGRMERLVAEIRLLVRDDAPAPEPASLADLIAAFRATLPQLPRFATAAVEVRGPADLPAVRIDFSTALRVLLLAVDAAGAGAGEAVGRVELVVAPEPGQVHLTLRAGDVRTGGSHGSDAALTREATDGGIAVSVDPAGGRTVSLPTLG